MSEKTNNTSLRGVVFTSFFLLTITIGQEETSSSLLLSPQQDLDICQSTVYILQNNLPKRTSKKISKKLSKQERRVKKG